MFVRSVLRSFNRTGASLSGFQPFAKCSTGCGDNIGIVGVPSDRGQKINTEFHRGPQAIRDGGLIEELTAFNGK